MEEIKGTFLDCIKLVNTHTMVVPDFILMMKIPDLKSLLLEDSSKSMRMHVWINPMGTIGQKDWRYQFLNQSET